MRTDGGPCLPAANGTPEQYRPPPASVPRLHLPAVPARSGLPENGPLRRPQGPTDHEPGHPGGQPGGQCRMTPPPAPTEHAGRLHQPPSSHRSHRERRGGGRGPPQALRPGRFAGGTHLNPAGRARGRPVRHCTGRPGHSRRRPFCSPRACSELAASENRSSRRHHQVELGKSAPAPRPQQILPLSGGRFRFVGRLTAGHPSTSAASAGRACRQPVGQASAAQSSRPRTAGGVFATSWT